MFTPSKSLNLANAPDLTKLFKDYDGSGDTYFKVIQRAVVDALIDQLQRIMQKKYQHQQKIKSIRYYRLQIKKSLSKQSENLTIRADWLGEEKFVKT
jgi:hypothetical protein